MQIHDGIEQKCSGIIGEEMVVFFVGVQSIEVHNQPRQNFIFQ